MEQAIRFCTTADGVRIAYATRGAGPPLVWVTSWLTHLNLDLHSPLWSHWIKALSQHHTLVRYDARGVGLSDRVVDNLSVDAWTLDIEAVVDDLGLTHFPLLGFCQGGAPVMNYAVRHPERVSRIVLYDSYLQGAFAEGSDVRAKQEAEALSEIIAIGWGREVSAFREVFANLLIPNASKEHQRWLGELERKTVSPEMAVRLWRAFHHISVHETAKNVQTPSLVFHISGNGMIPFEQGRQLAALIPDARFVPLEGENHILLEDEPAWFRFLAEVRAFLGVIGSEVEANNPHELFPELTSRELNVFKLMAQGASNEAIAEQLVITPKTVRNYVSHIYSKLDVNSRAKAIILAREAGLG
jgi:pimeloyl-ACP methyl ester carboxylesterase/DNA-binding CsgD family transcriptional regulator